MIRLKFRCPGCGKSYSVKAESKESLLRQTFKCPSCGKATPFASVMSAPAPAPAMHTHIAGGGLSPENGLGDMKTRVAGMAPRQAPIVLVVESTGRRIPLTVGPHILGRDSADSPADIKVAPDSFMSRSHARLDIIPNGATFICRIQAMRSANAVMINSRQLAENESWQLKPSDKILLGMTIVHLEVNR